jgi:hypothetical protein
MKIEAPDLEACCSCPLFSGIENILTTSRLAPSTTRFNWVFLHQRYSKLSLPCLVRQFYDQDWGNTSVAYHDQDWTARAITVNQMLHRYLIRREIVYITPPGFVVRVIRLVGCWSNSRSKCYNLPLAIIDEIFWSCSLGKLLSANYYSISRVG